MVVRTLALVIVRRVVGLIGLGPASDAKDIQIAVLRHQLMVVCRQVAGSHSTPQDRLVLAMVARLPPRQRWAAFCGYPCDVAALAQAGGGPPWDLSTSRAPAAGLGCRSR